MTDRRPLRECHPQIDLTRMASAAWASASVTVPAFASPLGASLRPTTGRSARQGDKDGATRGSRRAASARAAVGGGAPDKARRAWMEEKQRELASLLRGERAREEERQRLMAQIRDVRERERIQSIFSVERKRAMDAIQDLVNTLASACTAWAVGLERGCGSSTVSGIIDSIASAPPAERFGGERGSPALPTASRS